MNYTFSAVTSKNMDPIFLVTYCPPISDLLTFQISIMDGDLGEEGLDKEFTRRLQLVRKLGFLSWTPNSAMKN